MRGDFAAELLSVVQKTPRQGQVRRHHPQDQDGEFSRMDWRTGIRGTERVMPDVPSHLLVCHADVGDQDE